ncbi:DsbA family protein [Actinomadura macrotermitis]|uniref:Thioredoxin-like fold domain-containing protein n=1 Tax=Actinomadura macrotermitis TaxID=2585200 RepID=A0A7K0BN60_9ACTN|nr:thioredoxin domain-containing protein [Actinomadura macrotermitis]MQY02516.1 hypothetical protein [Actinomadura macrotermitis]
MGEPPNAPWPGAQPPGGPGYGPPGPPGMPWAPGPPMPQPPRRGPGLAIALVAGALTILLVAAIAIVLVLRGDDKGGGGGGGPVELKVGQVAGGAEARPGPDGSLAMARPGVERPLVEVYEDFACDHCGKFDKMHDPMLKELAVAGKAKVVFRPLVVFSAGTEPAYGNSLRAASAQRCLGDGAHWLAYQDALYEHQPATLNTRGYELDDLVSYAAPLGITDEVFRKCVTSQQESASVLAVSRGYLAAGLQGTPAVRLNGVLLPADKTGTPEALRAAIESGG